MKTDIDADDSPLGAIFMALAGKLIICFNASRLVLAKDKLDKISQ